MKWRWTDARSGGQVNIPLFGTSAKLYPGRADPVDESHFTIKYEIDDKPGTIDGWLQADDTVKLQIRDGPALQAATAPSQVR